MQGSTTRPELTGSFGMVASTHWLATATGTAVLERGGNAYDAAAAAGFVLQVVEPHLNGPGGDLPVVHWSEADQRVSVVCGQGPVPAAATPEVFADLGLDAVPGTGPLAATVPGAFGAWTLLVQRWGTWRLRDVLEPAIALARDGAPVLPRVSATLGAVAELFTSEWTTSAETYLVGGRPPAPWSRLRLPGVAATYERVLAEAEAAGADRDAQYAAARDAWYRGFVAEAVDAACRTAWLDTSGERHAGLLTADDLAGWEPGVEASASATYRGVEVHKTAQWGQGPLLLQALQVLDRVGLPAALEDDDPAWVHAAVEAQKLAFADREAWYGDPDGADGLGARLLADLLDPAYADGRRALVGDDAAGDLLPGSPGGRTPRLPVVPEGGLGPGSGGVSAGVGEPTVRRDGRTSGDTCHVDVVDRWGNLVSATPSGGWLQSSPVVPGLGFPLGTRAQMCWLQPGLPSSLRPGLRPRTTLSPSIALREGRPWLAFGTPGGDQQDAWQLLFLLRAVHAAEAGGPTPLQACVDAPMLHSEHAPSSFYPRAAQPRRVVAEDRWPAAVLEDLRRRGHEVVPSGGWSLGRLSAVARDGEWLRAAANPRGAQGYAAGR